MGYIVKEENFEQIAGVVERGTEKGGNWESEMLVNTGSVDDVRVFIPSRFRPRRTSFYPWRYL